MDNEPKKPERRARTLPSAWPFRADPPQRYWGNYDRYIQRGGLVDLEEDIKGFAAHGNLGDTARFYFFSLVFDQICKEQIPGDFAELGVYRGNTAYLLTRMARRLGRTAFLLDTFEGFDESDFRGIDANQKMQFVDTSLEAVRAMVGDANVRFVQGHFPQSADELPNTTYALVHIDCDLYAPILSALNYFYPRMQPGGFIVIHDYMSLAWDGAERAVDEFFLDKPESVIPVPDGAGSVVIRRARVPSIDASWLDRKRLALFGAEWTSAGKGHLTECLGTGWGGPEEWGLWGIGPVHELTAYLRGRADRDVVLEIDVHAPFGVQGQSHIVDVAVQGRSTTPLTFTEAENRGIRSIVIPRKAIPDMPVAAVKIEFKPRQTVRPIDHNPASGDIRELGMALHRLRLRPA